MSDRPINRRWFQFTLRMSFITVTFVGVGLGVVAWLMPAKRLPIGFSPETCALCKSKRSLTDRKWNIDYASPTFANCKHIWQGGLNFAVEAPIIDGFVVLVRSGDVYGAFVPFRQSSVPETLSYKWCYRSDGKGTFDSADSQVHCGGGSGSPIEFGPFSIAWSGQTDGSGFIYYHKAPGFRIDKDDLRICVTEESDMHSVDACESKWIFKAAPGDHGIAGGILAK